MHQAKAIRTRAQFNTHSAFTLVEICVAVFLMVLVLGAVVPQIINLSRHEELREASRTLRIMAKTAQNHAVQNGSLFVLQMERDTLLLRPGDPEAPDIHEEPIHKSVTYQIRNHLIDDWQTADGQLWPFLPSGVTVPMEIMLRTGSAWIYLKFDPLTASVSEENYYFP